MVSRVDAARLQCDAAFTKSSLSVKLLLTELRGAVLTFLPVEPAATYRHGARGSAGFRARVGRFKPHLLSASTLDIDDVDAACELADRFEASGPSSRFVGRTVALVFFQSSTRTRLGFEAAAVALGAHAIGMEDMTVSSRSNGRVRESLEDCAAVISRLFLRWPRWSSESCSSSGLLTVTRVCRLSRAVTACWLDWRAHQPRLSRCPSRSPLLLRRSQPNLLLRQQFRPNR